jgi:tellurite methyltransferase
VSARDRVRWDEAYLARLNAPYPAPDPLLLLYTSPVAAGAGRTALDLAAGFGQNGLWLAEQGYVTDLVDISRVALQRAREEATRRGIRTINLMQVDTDDMVDAQSATRLDRESYDLVAVFRFLVRPLFGQLRDAIRPGGRIIYETFNCAYAAQVPPSDPAHLLEAGELRGYFEGWQVLLDQTRGPSSQFVAIKPRA